MSPFYPKARRDSTPDSPPTHPPRIRMFIDYNEDGFVFGAEGRSRTDWLRDDAVNGGNSGALLLLAQLEEEGYCTWLEDRMLLPWESIYKLSESPEYPDLFQILGLPSIEQWRPVLQSSGSFSDNDFSLFIAGWISPISGRRADDVRIKGAVLQHNGELAMVTPAAWEVSRLLRTFHRREPQERTADSNRRIWAEVRRHAIRANADLGDFLRQTVVISPERLKLELRKGDINAPDLVEVIPTFAGAPRRWIEFFDRSKDVQVRYDIPDGEGLTHILVPEQTRSVLREIKRMPGRRIVGERAESFVRNPFALLGPDANTVLDPAEFEEAREAAGLSLTRFTPHLDRDKEGGVIGVELRIEEIHDGRIREEFLPFVTPDELQRFLSKIRLRLGQQAECCSWNGFDLDLLGESAEHIDLLQKALDEWRLPRPFAAAEILDLSMYSERIEGFGVEKAYYCPFIARKNNGLSWVPENLAFGFFYTPAGSEEAIAIELDDKGFVELKSRVEQARRTNSETFVFPGCPKPVRTVEAEQILVALSEAKSASSNNEFKPEKDSTATGPVERRGLVVKPNIEELDYEERRGALSIPSGLTPRLPGLLKPDFPLKPHQAEGVTWLQHLWSRSPSECRGALLADDMGLGKTLQLLTFIAAELELDHKLDPCLIVAPVSLLENWKEEIEKFFEVGAFRVLTLYGNDLSKLRLSRSEIEDELAAAGVGKLLVRNWLAGARLVLTTYETLRDLEFSLSRQKWSIMICDEAQKIKNPNALVSRAAKKQNARFKIACTGTPVENTLTDLWCLFDFIQPGLLGSLNRFGQTYRRPIEAETEDEKVRIQELRELIEPQKLRRTKKEVAKDLPNKIEVPTCRTLPLSDRQRVIYSREVDRYRRQVAGSQAGSVGNHLGLIQVLRRICSDPQALYSTPGSFEPLEEAAKHSPKLSWLLTQLEEIQSKSEKVIIFCELRDLQRKLQSSIAQRFGLTPDIINGETAAAGGKSNSRQQRIKAFQSQAGFGVIILSPLAVGFGVNIQGANHVIHFTRTWNPAKEDQATDRAYRIGQTRDVYVYYPVVVAPDFVTFDAKLDSLLDWKRGLSDDMLNGIGELSAAEFSDLQNVDGARALTL